MRQMQLSQGQVLNTESNGGGISPPGTTKGKYDKFEDEGSQGGGKEDEAEADRKNRRLLLSQDGDNCGRNNDTLESDLNNAKVTAADQQYWTA